MSEIEKARGSLGRRLSVLLVSLALLPLLLGGSLAIVTTYQLGREEVASRQQMALQLGQALIRNYLDTLLGDLEIAGNLALQAPDHPETPLRSLCLNRQDFVELSVVDGADGHELARLVHCTPLAAGALGNRSAYEPFFRARRGEVYISDVSFVEGNDPYIRVSRPVVQEGKRVLVVMAVVNLQSLWQPLRDLDPGAGGYFYLVDRRGNLMAFRELSMVRQARTLADFPPVHAVLSGTDLTGLYTYRGLYGQWVVGRAAWMSLVPEDQTSPWGWGLVVEMTRTLAFAGFNRISVGLAALLFVVAMTGLGLAWYQSRRIVDPIKALAQGAYAVADGRFDYQVPVTSEDEIGAVAQVFNLMTARLRELVSRLEARVEQQALLRWATQHINSAGLEAERVYVAIHEALTRLMPCEAIVIAWKDVERNRIELVYRVDQGIRAPYAELDGTTGLTGWVLTHGTPLFIEDITAFPDIPVVHFGSGESVRSILAVPLRRGDEVVGVLSVQSYQPGAYTRDHLELLELVGAQAIVAMENIWLFESRQRQLHELQVLNTVAQAAVAATSEDELIEKVTDLVGDTFFPAHFGLMLVDESTHTLRFHPSYRGLTGKTEPIPLGEGITGWVALSGQPLCIGDISQDPRYIDRSEGRMLSELCVPLQTGGRVLGVLNAESTQKNAFTEADERLLVTVASQLTTAIERLRFFDETCQALERERRLNAVAHIISSNLDEDRILRQVVSLAGELIQADTGGFALASSQGDSLEFSVPYTYQLPPGTELPPLPEGVGLAWEIFKTQTPMLIPDYPAHPKAVAHFVAAGVQSFVGVPVTVGERSFGVLAMFRYRTSPPFTGRELSILESVARQTGIALSNARLLAESRQRASELALALAHQQELDRLKSEFVQNVSHELRTPLTIIRGYAEMLTDDETFLASVPPDYQEALQIITRRTRMLTDLVEDITLILGAERRQRVLAPLDLLALLRATQVEFAPLAEKAGLRFRADLPATLPPIKGVVIYLRRVLDNLLSNAIKFTPAGGSVSLRAWAEPDWVIVEVADTGIGIPLEQQTRIFDRFYQVDGSSRRRYGGVGLGLALVKELVEYHYGHVHVNSAPGEGSTFRVELPITGADEPQEKVPAWPGNIS